MQAKLKRHEELERQLADPDVLANVSRMVAIQREYGGLAKVAIPVREFNALLDDIQTARELLEDEEDPDARDYAEGELTELLQQQKTKQAELEELVAVGDTISRGSLIMEIRAGTGGDEAALFVRDLFEMYLRLAERRSWKFELIDSSPTELGGIKEITLTISGEGAFHQLQYESGGHRVQRVPETEAQGRIHTSAATVAVLPEANEIEIELKSDDLRIDTFYASGPGGQKVNKTASAIRITHLPTNTVVQCQDEKSQHKNKSKAMRVLRSRLLETQQQNQNEERASQRRTLIGSGDRSQRVRTYNFPQNRLTDHRIGLTLYKLDQVMQGQLDEVIEALLEFDRQERLTGDAGS